MLARRTLREYRMQQAVEVAQVRNDEMTAARGGCLSWARGMLPIRARCSFLFSLLSSPSSLSGLWEGVPAGPCYELYMAPGGPALSLGRAAHPEAPNLWGAHVVAIGGKRHALTRDGGSIAGPVSPVPPHREVGL